MESPAATAFAFSSDREQIPVTSASSHRCMAGITFLFPIFAVLKTPHRIFRISPPSVGAALGRPLGFLIVGAQHCCAPWPHNLTHFSKLFIFTFVLGTPQLRDSVETARAGHSALATSLDSTLPPRPALLRIAFRKLGPPA